jgi:ABC-type microcin C transport system duplicated ATPase subunit YejF
MASNGNPSPLIEVRHLKTWFPAERGLLARVSDHVKAVDDVSFDVERGEVLGLVGESGSGKTTVGRSLLRLIQPTGGSIRFDGLDVISLSHAGLRAFRRRAQIIFQDPFASLDPRMTVAEIVGEALVIHKLARGRRARAERVAELLGLSTWAAIRTSSPAASASGSGSRARSRSSPSSSSPTSRSRRSTSRSRPRS